jgi:ribose transport system substrate-binding protein
VIALTAAALVGGLVLAGCSGGAPATEKKAASSPAAGAGSDSTGVPDGTGKTIGFTISTMDNPFFVSMKEGIDAAQAETGATVIFSDANNDPSKQADDIGNFIAQGVDAAVLNATDSDAITASVEALNAAGIPVITVDRVANGGEVVTHIGTDNVTAGEIAAKALFEAMGGKGKVAILEGVPGASSATERGTGFENVEKDYPGIEVVASQTANYDRAEGLTVAQNMLQANPDLGGILSMNDEMGLGAVEAIKAAGLTGKVLVNGIDGGADAVKAVADGAMVFTVAQQSKLMGQQGIEDALRVLAGQSLPANQPVDVIVINSDNVADYQ